MHRRGSSLLLPSLSLNPSSSSPAAAEPPQPPRQGPRRVRKGRRQSRAPGRRGGACSGCRSCRLCPCAPGFSGQTDGLGLAPPRPSPPPLTAAARRLPSRRTSVSLTLSSPQLLVLNFDFFFFLAPKGVCGGRRARVRAKPPVSRSGVWETAGRC